MERRLLTLIAIFAAAALLTLMVELRQEKPLSPSTPPVIPEKAGSWQGRRIAPTREELEILGADNVEYMRYHKSPGPNVVLCVVRERRKRASFHPPEYCYLAQSNVSIVGKGRALISLNGKKLEASTMTLQTEGGKTLVVYWYRTGNYHTPSYYKHQLSFIWRMFRWGGSDSSMVRLTTQIGEDGVEGALQRIEDLLRNMVPHYSAL